MQVNNGIPADQLAAACWRKSRVSNPSGSCVEVAGLPGGAIAVRNSRHPSGPALIFDRAEVAAFLACLLYTSPSPRDGLLSRMPSSA